MVTTGQKVVVIILITLSVLATLFVIVIPLALSLIGLFIPIYAYLNVCPKEWLYSIITLIILCVVYLSCYFCKLIYDPIFPYNDKGNKKTKKYS